jgi:predicted amidohydrolase
MIHQVFILIVTTLLLGLDASNGMCAAVPGRAIMPERIRIALLHLDARPGEIGRNRRIIENAIARAVAERADWVLTPELAETGYGFAARIGTGWIESFPDQWIRSLAAGARRNGVALFIGIAERDSTTGNLHNSVAVIDKDGVIQGTYRKHRVVNGPAEKWASRGIENNLFTVDGIPIGFLICADAYKDEISSRHKQMGARILLSPANWPPAGEMGPKGYWEERSRETGLPVIVNNRTGVEPGIDFSAGESAAIARGKRLFTLVSPHPQLVLLDWDRANGTITPAGTIKLNE